MMTKSMTRIGTAVGAALLTVGLGAAALSIAGISRIKRRPPTADAAARGSADRDADAAGLAARWDRSADSRCGSSI